jgi:hypothetical protein
VTRAHSVFISDTQDVHLDAVFDRDDMDRRQAGDAAKSATTYRTGRRNRGPAMGCQGCSGVRRGITLRYAMRHPAFSRRTTSS